MQNQTGVDEARYRIPFAGFTEKPPELKAVVGSTRSDIVVNAAQVAQT